VGLVLLIDDAEAMPEETAPQLARAARESDGALRLVAAAAETAAGPLAQTWDHAERVTLRKPMDLEETSRYLVAHLEAAGLPEAVRAAFDASSISELHGRSGGIPGRVNPEASLVLRRVLAREEEGRPRAEEHDAAFERAAGRLALAHSDLAYEDAGEESTATFERAAGRLTLAQLEAEAPFGAEPLEIEPLEAEPLIEAELPAEAERPPDDAGAEAAVAAAASAHAGAALSAPSMPEPGAEELPGAPPPGARRGPVWGGWLIVFGVFFVIGGGVGVWLGQRWLAEPQTQAPAPLPVAAVPAAPSPSETSVAPGVPSAAQEPAAPAVVVRVQINANPWATILVDGEEVGVTPLAGVSVGAGSHSFEAHFPDGRIVERVVEIDEVNRFVVFP
jgi:hypothetical protein